MDRDLSIAAVIPAFNAAATLRRAIASVLSQTEPPQQTVVVDDGSTDATAAVASEYGSAVCVVRQQNQGASAARNRGLAECRTTAVAFLDADDEWLPLKLAQQRTIFRNHPELKWCFTHMVEVHGGQVQEQVLPPDIAAQLKERPVMPYLVAAERDLSTGTCGAVLRLDVVRAAGGFNPTRRIAEDRDLWWRIAMSHPDIGYGPDVAWRYHTDTPSSLMKTSPDRSDSLRVVCEHLRWWRREQRVEFERYGRRLALNYLARAAARQIYVERAVLADAESLLGLSTGRRALLAAIRYLPRPLARPLVARLPDR